VILRLGPDENQEPSEMALQNDFEFSGTARRDARLNV